MKVSEAKVHIKSAPVAATVGFFDGVHRGHRYLLNSLQEEAALRGMQTAAVTFKTHPRIVLASDYQPQLLNTLDERLELLSQTGIDQVFLVDFNRQFAYLTAQQFISEVLSAKYNVRLLLVGYDNRFGHCRSEGFEAYCVYGRECGVEVLQAQPENIDGGTVIASSSAIRRMLTAGDVAQAARMLGYNYTIQGTVVKGFQIGRTIGFPTANLSVAPDKLLPRNGSYAVRTHIGAYCMDGMLYVGERPSFNSAANNRTVEVNVFGLTEAIYGVDVQVELVDFLRDDTQYDTVEQLIEQIEHDKARAIKILNGY